MGLARILVICGGATRWWNHQHARTTECGWSAYPCTRGYPRDMSQIWIGIGLPFPARGRHAHAHTRSAANPPCTSGFLFTLLTLAINGDRPIYNSQGPKGKKQSQQPISRDMRVSQANSSGKSAHARKYLDLVDSFWCRGPFAALLFP